MKLIITDDEQAFAPSRLSKCLNDRPSLSLSFFMVKLCEIVKNSDEFVQSKIRFVLNCILKVVTGFLTQ